MAPRSVKFAGLRLILEIFAQSAGCTVQPPCGFARWPGPCLPGGRGDFGSARCVMSVSSLNSSSPYSYLQWPLQSASTGPSDPTDPAAPSDPLQSLYGAMTGGSSGDPLLSALGDDDGSSSSGIPQFSPDVMQALFSVQGNQGASGTTESPLFAKFDANGDGQVSQSE